MYREHLADYLDEFVVILKKKITAFEIDHGNAWRTDPQGQEKRISNWVMQEFVAEFKTSGTPIDFVASFAVAGYLGWVRKTYWNVKEKPKTKEKLIP